MSRRTLTPFLIGAALGAGFVTPVALSAGPATAQVRGVAPAPTTEQAEAALRKSIAGIQNGNPDYEGMSQELADGLREQQPQITPQLASLGLPKTYARVGAGENPWIWDVTFEKDRVLTWTISLAPGGQTITGLFVQPKGAPATP